MEFGAPPNVDRLGGLTRGDSSKADVLLALGQPRGAGGALIEPGSEPADIWFYELVKTDGREVSVQILLVFFDGDSYDGHLWFRSAETLRGKRSQALLGGDGLGRMHP